MVGDQLTYMTNSPDRTSIPDGGSLRRRDDSNEGDNGFDLDVELPEDSLFDLDDYLKMYEVASKPKQYLILEALAENNQLSTSELSMVLGEEDNALHYPLRTLKDVALIKNRRDPNTGTEETYSYYELTELGRIVLTEGIREGVKILARQEASLEDKYSK
ncbi:MarR family transcriptional regulator [Halorubrum kocurii JCM 14978]|uniref:MarR family transcriptional regulator n=2 Tax=Halorubrum kocurii TaxID=478441 RepID=M0PKQ0_9EURY|nr:MarR family transcriptional regulator [Halorubrum kocurii JCM 14978]